MLSGDVQHLKKAVSSTFGGVLILSEDVRHLKKGWMILHYRLRSLHGKWICNRCRF